MENQEELAKLRALREQLDLVLRNERVRFFDPLTVIDLFERFSLSRDRLLQERAGLFEGIPVRDGPALSGTSDNDGRGYIERRWLELLARDVSYCLSLLENVNSVPEDATVTSETSPEPDVARRVFVVHGRDLAARDSTFAFLRALDLDPIEWSEAVQATNKATPYIGEILDAAFSMARAVLVLMTPDDEARLRSDLVQDDDPQHERELTPQVRPNVLFEAGMAIGRDPDRTLLVEVGRLRPFSDIGGRHTVRLDDSVARRQDIAQRLRAAGCAVKLEGSDWHTVGSFATDPPPGGGNSDQFPKLSQVAGTIHDDTDRAQGPEADEPGFLELLVEAETAFPMMSDTLEKMTVVNEAIGAIAEAATEEMARADTSGAQLATAIRFANSLQGPSTRMEELSIDYSKHVAGVRGGVEYLISQLETETSVGPEAWGFVSAIRGLADATGASMKSVTSMSESIDPLQDAARALRDPTRRLRSALDRVVEASNSILQWGERLADCEP